MISIDSVSAQVNSYSDTTAKPWGTTPAIRYWGGGDPTEPERQEMVTCWAAINSDTTVAHVSFHVWTR
jgi:hypothetical protein